MSLPEKGHTPEIEKLLEKIKKDPASKLFVPLAEEYVKGGMLDEAMAVLKEGLQVHPTYLTARVSLGKIYLQKALVGEAKLEFENVIKMNPDNLLAHRKLAGIYKAEGALEPCRSSCQKVLAQSPADKEMGALLHEVEDLIAKGPATPEVRKDAQPPAADNGRAIAPPVSSDTDEAPDRGAQPPSLPPLERPSKDLMDESDLEALGLASLGMSDSKKLQNLVEQVAAQPPPPAPAPLPVHEAAQRPPEGTSESWVSVGKEIEAAEQTVVQSTEDALLSPTLAELYISQGHLEKGIEIYRRLLERNPQDEILRSRLAAIEGSGVQTPAPSLVSSAEKQEKPPDSRREEKLRRLQAWLENLKKGAGE